MAEDSELWDIICDGPYVPTKALEELPFSMSKTSKEYTDADRKVMEKNFCAKKIMVCGIGPKEYSRISVCDTAKEIWEALQISHEGTIQALAAWGNSYGESEDETDAGDSSMMAVEGEENEYLRETIETLETISKAGNSGKGKEIASDEHIRLEDELKSKTGARKLFSSEQTNSEGPCPWSAHVKVQGGTNL
uniref:Uncharacterized protein n=1 Tax=Nicotiana tabacum TaxID=4097 RepID=A0A1S3XL44_TOBAC|nr:PREDICTED: uncharacterized protein LOC107766444 [Nicotiana tabacum]